MERTDDISSVYAAITRWSTRLIDAGSADRLEVTRRALEELCQALGAARGLYFGFRDGDSTAVVEAEWKAPGLSSAIGAEYAEAEAGVLFSLLRREQVVVCYRDGEEPELAPLRDILESEQLVADLVVPVQRHGMLTRTVAIDFVSPPRVTPAALREVGNMVRDVLAAAERRGASDAAWREQLNAQAHQQKLHSLGTMVGGILHDVNNVFQVVTGMSELLLTEADPEARRQMVGDILSATGRGADLCHRVLLFSRQGVRPQQTFRLADRVLGMAPLLRAAIPEDRAFSLQVTSGEYAVTMPEVELEHAVLNLCNNAVEATSAGEEIIVSCRVDDRGMWATVEVSDTGRGMDAEVLERALEAFYTTKPMGAGTGLGLAMVQRAITDAGGTVSLHSEAGSGTRVSLRMPTSSAAVHEERVPGDLSHGHETVLLVEDDAMILRVTASALRRRGYTVLTAAHGAEALTLLDTYGNDVDLVITDMVMPEVGGAALHRAVAARGLTVPFLFATGYDAGQLRGDVLPDGSWALLLKPYTVIALHEAVRELLDR